MKKLLNTLYIYTQGSYLSKDRETIIIKNGKEKIGQFPAINITGIFCFGRISISPPLMGYCAERGIAIVFFTIYGRFQARVQGKVTGNVLLRREQYRRADDANYSFARLRACVAPYMGAWIETFQEAMNKIAEESRALYGCVD